MLNCVLCGVWTPAAEAASSLARLLLYRAERHWRPMVPSLRSVSSCRYSPGAAGRSRLCFVRGGSVDVSGSFSTGGFVTNYSRSLCNRRYTCSPSVRKQGTGRIFVSFAKRFFGVGLCSASSKLHRQYHKSSMATAVVLRLLASSVRVADRAGNIIRDIMSKGDLQIVDKGINDLQTEADRSVQRCILASLHSQFPDVTIIGEEEATADSDPDWVELTQAEEVLACESKLPDDLRSAEEKDVCVWVDPLDGTNEYTQGMLDHVTVLIGIALKGKAVAGVMHQPYYNYKAGPDAPLGRTIWGIVGVGTFGIERKILDRGSRVIVTTRSHETDAVRSAIAACEPTEVIRVGGAGHKVLLLIEGKAHAYVFASPGCKKWDTCAPEAVLQAIGGMLTDIHGNSYEYDPGVVRQNTGGVLATAFAEDQPWYVSKMPAEVKAMLAPS